MFEAAVGECIGQRLLSSVECFPLCEKAYVKNGRIRHLALIPCEEKEQSRRTEEKITWAEVFLLIIRSRLNRKNMAIIPWVNTTVR